MDDVLGLVDARYERLREWRLDRFAEAEGIARADLPSDEAAANVAYLRTMLAQQNGWKGPGQPGKSPVRAQGS